MWEAIVWVVGSIVIVAAGVKAFDWFVARYAERERRKLSTPDTDEYYGGRVEPAHGAQLSAIAPLPSVGRVVHFYGFLPAMNGEGDDTSDQGPFKADVLDCKGDDPWCVSILVHNRHGVAWMRHNVPVGDITKPDQKEWWEWPPRR